MRSRAGIGMLAGAALVAVLAGCSQPGPLAVRLAEPQSTFDRVVALQVEELDDQSVRYLGRHGDTRYWVGTLEGVGHHCLSMLHEATRQWVLLGCGGLPLVTEWMGMEAVLIPDGADPDARSGNWTAVTPNLLVRGVPGYVFTG